MSKKKRKGFFDSQEEKEGAGEKIVAKNMVFVRMIRPVEARAEHGELMPGQVIALPEKLVETYIEEHLAIYWVASAKDKSADALENGKENARSPRGKED